MHDISSAGMLLDHDCPGVASEAQHWYPDWSAFSPAWIVLSHPLISSNKRDMTSTGNRCKYYSVIFTSRWHLFNSRGFQTLPIEWRDIMTSRMRSIIQLLHKWRHEVILSWTHTGAGTVCRVTRVIKKIEETVEILSNNGDINNYFVSVILQKV